MTYSRGINASDATLTKNRLASVCPSTGMCVTCTEGCPGLCEVGKSAYRGRESIYPQPFGRITTASQKDYPIDLSHFNLMGTLLGARGCKAGPDRSNFLSADTTLEIGKCKPITLNLPVIVSALGSTRVARENWEGLAVGCAISGTLLTIGENVCGMDPDAEFIHGKVTRSPEMERRVRLFREWQEGSGDIVVQENMEDARLGVLDYAIGELGIECVEIKWGQGAKSIGGEVKLTDLESALLLKRRGYIVLPDPEDPLVQDAFKAGAFREFERHSRVGMVSYDAFLERVEHLRRSGAKNVFLKTGAYRPSDLAFAIKCASDARIDLLTVDGAGGGTGMSPWRMMNEWGIPTVYLLALLTSYMEKVREQGGFVPHVAINGGFALEDQILKGLALGAPFVRVVGMARGPLAAAMVGKTIGASLKTGRLPDVVGRYGEDLEQIFSSYIELKRRYGQETSRIPPGAIGLFTYLDRIQYGIRQFMCGMKKFSLPEISRDDIAALTEEASRLTGIPHVRDLDTGLSCEILSKKRPSLQEV